MVLSRRIDDKEIQLKNQSLIFFQISGAGHEAILVAAGMTLKAGLRLVLSLLPRSRVVPDARRDAARDVPRRRRRRRTIRAPADARCRRTGAAKRLNIVSQSSPTGTQCLQAVGCAEAGGLYERITTIDGARSGSTKTKSSSLGRRRRDQRRGVLGVAELGVPRTAAAGLPRRGQRLRDLGAREVQTAGGDISKLVASFPGLLVQSIDGTDFLASHRAMADAVAYARARKGPAFVHARVTRPVLALAVRRRKAVQDDRERAAEARRDPIVRLPQLLTSERLATEAGTRRRSAREVERR